jgi:6-phosphogluconolactonase
MLTLREFANFSALSDHLSRQWLATIIATPVDQRCSFALAGGSTPAPLYRQFDALYAASGARPIQLLATDERWVADSDPQSNEGLFRQCFAASRARWNLISLKNSQPNPADAVQVIDARLKENCPDALTAIILGMGADGHIASLFPDAPQLLTTRSESACVAALHPESRQARMSLSFARLLDSKSIWLVITGSEKRRVLEDAAKTGAGPIGALLAAASVEVFWCP